MKGIRNEKCIGCKGVKVYKRHTKDGEFIQYVVDGVILAQHAAGLSLDKDIPLSIKFAQDCVSYAIGVIVYGVGTKIDFSDSYSKRIRKVRNLLGY